MGDNTAALNTGGLPSQNGTKRRRVRQSKWDNPDESNALNELDEKQKAEELQRKRRLYVGNLPTGIDFQQIVEFFTETIKQSAADVIANSNIPEPLVYKTEVFTMEQGYCFVEFATPELADICFKLDGIEWRSKALKIRRPIDYHNGHKLLDDTKIFVRNIPLDMSEKEITEIMQQHGKVKIVNLVRDPQTGQHKGYGFFEFNDVKSAKTALVHLNGHSINGHVLSVKQAAFSYFASGGKLTDCKATNLPSSVTQFILSNPLLGLQMQTGRKVGCQPTRLVQLLNVVFHEDLVNSSQYEELKKVITEEAEKYGHLEKVTIPRPEKDAKDVPGVGKVFLLYSSETAARKAQYMLNGRRFDKNRIVCAAFYPLDKFTNGKYTLY
ncbi:bifunctional Nucleotide-binding alpha-beta plait domain superfamily/RNA recognition motif domain/RNA-binding domain superfamily [Babesia duncani]|uniref:Bifunctional Nucleotide-binding alpha-beta plait domain superfamily/RNA recognition motif domain/RNA-binding domain superfamily n=1 Tax=Babesia duncani TaxID=323732 RepID=A0AAD9PIW6_9APIC|nr:bifunctional Nucleotide-binding alpha-beta plait domain superfamily/RNA recognition motif domain/RNA-binding domain superfamily [Babesia duncani]